ncbi:HlyD family secretion protein [Thermohalobacter berrensis]|uniref:RND efflux pump membrane fusion protein barrel-sandwich domain-containing protein n=1 Tax=Thermohalobacter berrensis TaxID=99594 RepID=A0A419T185_9FIRM|nr:efflux RND transporter periplasmic adaptor subunit [Thermohalobacter berrensis]RKD31235.1 hypothetical protein BET03_03665 [Thermohalobacter berrensis]
MNKKGILLIIVTILILSGCTNTENKKLVYTGFVEAEEINIPSEIGGVIKRVLVKEGQNIEKGTTIAEIDTTSLEIQLKQLKAQLKSAKAQLEELKEGTRSEEIDLARTNLENAKVVLDGAKKNYEYRLERLEKIEKMYKENGASEQQVKDAKALVDEAYTKMKSAEKNYYSAKSRLDLLLKGPRGQKIKAAEGKVEGIIAQIELLEYQISKGKIKSPINGTVENINFNKGELIPKGGNIASVIDLDNLWVKVYIPEKYLHRVSLGDELNLYSNHLKDEEIKGKIIYISNEAEFTPKNVESKENKEEMVFEVKVEINDKKRVLKPGMLVDVRLDGGK